MLADLRAEALDSLLEMARWRYIGHADAALTILGRIAGIEEDDDFVSAVREQPEPDARPALRKVFR